MVQRMLIQDKKKKNRRRIISMILCVVMIISLMGKEPSYAATYSKDYLSISKEVINWKKRTLEISKDQDLFTKKFLMQAGTSGVDWYAIGIGRLGMSDSYHAYLKAIEQNIVRRYRSTNQLDVVRATEWHRTGLAILSCGGDPTQLQKGTINLVEDGCYNRGKKMPLNAQGDNAWFWALILMDGLRYKIPEQAVDQREQLTRSILSKQQPDGGFSFGKNSSPDATGMALQALAPYYNKDKLIRNAIDQAIEYLSLTQKTNGNYSNDGDESCESLVQVIIGLCSIGIDPQKDSRFIKNGHNLVEAFLKFQQKDGGFGHMSNQGRSDSIASEQALLALTALIRFDKRLHNIYDFRNEPNTGIKDLIVDLDTAIMQLKDKPDVSRIKELYNNYLVIPAQERSYVRNYHILANLMESSQVAEVEEDFWDIMNQNECGNGYLFSLQDETELSLDIPTSQETTQHTKEIEKSNPIGERLIIAIFIGFGVVLLFLNLRRYKNKKGEHHDQ